MKPLQASQLNVVQILKYLHIFFYWESVNKKAYYQIPIYPVIPYPQYDTPDQLDLITVVWLYNGFLRFYIKIILKTIHFFSKLK